MLSHKRFDEHIPKISVCIPVYNGARHLADTVRSVLNQSCEDFELVVSDNASTDATPDVVAGFADKRILYERNHTNLGPVGNFNRCLELARGTYTKILCADDLIYPDCLARQATVLDQDVGQNLSFVYCRRDIIDGAGHLRWRPRAASGPGRQVAEQAVRMTIRSGTNIFGEPQSVLFRTKQARQVGGFDPAHSFCLDLDFWLRLLALGDAYHLPERLCAFRVSNNSWSTRLIARQAKEFRAFVEHYAQTHPEVPAVDVQTGARRAILHAYSRRLFYLWLTMINLTTPAAGRPSTKQQ